MICLECKRQRPTVRRLARAMEADLRRNDSKGGWNRMDRKQLMARLNDEIRELKIEIYDAVPRPKRILRECADVANFVMMIADLYGRENHHTKRPGAGKISVPDEPLEPGEIR